MLEFSEFIWDACDIQRFQTVHGIKTHFLLENLWISEPSLGILEKFQLSLKSLCMNSFSTTF